jgi:transcriptional regulator with XRE-family HTH domain
VGPVSRQTEYQPPWFHDGLYKAFIQSGMSIPEIARKANISKSHAYRIFAAEQWPSVPVMMRLEDAMGLERGTLIRKEKSSN